MGGIAACASAVMTALWAIDAFGLVGVPADYTATGAGQLADEARFYAGWFARDWQLVWFFRARETASRRCLSWYWFLESGAGVVGRYLANLV